MFDLDASKEATFDQADTPAIVEAYKRCVKNVDKKPRATGDPVRRVLLSKLAMPPHMTATKPHTSGIGKLACGVSVADAVLFCADPFMMMITLKRVEQASKRHAKKVRFEEGEKEAVPVKQSKKKEPATKKATKKNGKKKPDYDNDESSGTESELDRPGSDEKDEEIVPMAASSSSSSKAAPPAPPAPIKSRRIARPR